MEDGPTAQPGVDLESVLGELRARVEERRRSGAYPPGLEDELEGHFRRIAAHRVPARLRADELRERVEALTRLPAFSPERIETTSALPGGSAMHSAVARVVRRQTAGVLAQVQDLANALREALRALADAVVDPTTHVHPDLVGILDGVLERLAAYERAPATGSATPALAELGRRVRVLEEAEAARGVRPWFPVAGMVASPAETELEECWPERAEALVSLARGHEPVVVIGGGRLAGALAEAGVEASALDGAGPLGELEARADAGAGALVGSRIVEAMAPQRVLDLVRVAADKLRPGGVLALEAANPRSLWGLANGLLARPDLLPVDPGWLALLCEQAGLAGVEVRWLCHPSAAGAGEQAGPLAYVVTATRPPGSGAPSKQGSGATGEPGSAAPGKQ